MDYATRAPNAFSVALALALALAPCAARADDKRACLDSYVRGQERRRARALVESRAALVVCAQASCPAALRGDCASWLEEVDRALPSVVPTAFGPDGRELTEVRVERDGEPLRERLDGVAVAVDPGEHVFRFVAEGYPAREARVVVHEGEQSRRVSVTFGAPPAPRTADRTWGIYALGAAAVAGFADFGYFALSGLASKRDLDREQCKPSCPSAQVDDVRRKFVFGDVGLGVGALSLGVASYLWLSRPAAAPPSGASLVVGPRGAGACWGASF